MPSILPNPMGATASRCGDVSLPCEHATLKPLESVRFSQLLLIWLFQQDTRDRLPEMSETQPMGFC
jgi:hypothetical protein